MTRARMPRPHEIVAARRDPRLLRALAESQGDDAWRTRGLCRTADPETFFPSASEPADAAMALCRSCAVQGPCLAWALRVGDCHGVWGATTPRERRAMLVVWRAGTAEDGEAVPGAGELVATVGGVRTPLIPAQRRRLPLLPSPVRAGVDRHRVGVGS